VPDILLVEDKESLRAALRRALETRRYSVDDVGDAYEARRRLQAARYHVVLTDLRLPAGSGFDVLEAALAADPQTAVVVMTAFGTVDDAVKAMKQGAVDFLTKPVDTDHLLLLLDRAVERRRLLADYVVLKEENRSRYGLPQILGEDPELKQALLEVQRAAATDASVLILGESGTGKELMARSLHLLSPRAAGPFVAINCAAIPEPLLENELFGHEKGAFTGASARKRGRAEMADGGTLFLDEIGDMPLGIQSKLLRVVQEREFERVGGVQTLSVDIRIVAATNRDLRAAVADKTFREDLFFRLSVLPIEIPPLRRRRSDVLPLAETFLERYAREMSRGALRLSEESKSVLLAHPWPGNVRELQNCIERSAILCDGNEVRPEHLRLVASDSGGPRLSDLLDLSGSLADVTRRATALAEEAAVRLALQEAGGDRGRAAERLGISISTLGRRLRAAEAPER
jgi:DNA-binding NtrC family response regulator